ncbi:MAG: hypothetical protein JRG97_10155 [Deltaproteobacteria bacterium]|nr:hypothetical protein [Deltaproteobacteria bacterium]MBW2053381.1 hypothetical protein [Deltaproteobacteria bacterium]MBW2141417.1 hypothetical protein [Deltaproteobacteria bacterium]MBW2324232.1 hypothetical protein [Deltaproteobacteria bacterium]
MLGGFINKRQNTWAVTRAITAFGFIENFSGKYPDSAPSQSITLLFISPLNKDKAFHY